MSSNFNRLSRIFQPLTIIPANAKIKNVEGLSTSQKLLMDLGIIRPSIPGCYHILPLGVRAVEKLNQLIERHMTSVGAQKIEMPFLSNAELWKKTGRLKINNELFTVTDRHSKTLILNPTNEEAITDLVALVSPLSHRHLPLRLYQITNKFRDEMKPRFGLLRSRQFLMKDLYTFDTTLESASETYKQICDTYERIFHEIGIKFLKVNADTGDIGGTLSHEYHFLAPIGEDNLIVCNSCGSVVNEELRSDSGKPEYCEVCKEKSVRVETGIEVGHTFLLGSRYSAPLKATFLSSNTKTEYLQMGCYGLGISRIIAASLEILSTNNGLRWPLSFVPFSVVIISPKAGSKEEQATSHLTDRLYQTLNLITHLTNDIVIDDRHQMTIGKRLREARRCGYPYIVVIGARTANSSEYELYDLINNTEHYLSESQLISYIDINSKKCNLSNNLEKIKIEQ